MLTIVIKKYFFEKLILYFDIIVKIISNINKFAEVIKEE
ncbi:protein of unknown function [Clostridium beijerinckii]|nr:protein of unknown function [Clostridium beijerinckii]